MLGIGGLLKIVWDASSLPPAEKKQQILNRVVNWHRGQPLMMCHSFWSKLSNFQRTAKGDQLLTNGHSETASQRMGSRLEEDRYASIGVVESRNNRTPPRIAGTAGLFRGHAGPGRSRGCVQARH